MNNNLQPNQNYLTDFTNIKDSRKYCIDKIIELKKTKKFYIGATHDPNERLKDHKNEKKMKHMFLLLELQNRDDTITMEKILINRFSKNKRILNDIQGGGGEGLIEGINYIYILFK
jgi:ribonuclease HIII